MSPTRTSKAKPTAFLGETQLIPRKELHPNSWNVNKLNAFQYAKLLESIQEYGFIDPILARPCPQHLDYEIIGGEHRWKGAGDLDIAILPVIVRQMTDPIAKKLSLIDNELHGQADPTELIDLLKDLRTELGPDLMTGLPFTDDILAGFLGSSSDAVPPLPAPVSSPADVGPVERFVERTYRMPAGAADVIDQAIARVKADGDVSEDWAALEMIAADFLGS